MINLSTTSVKILTEIGFRHRDLVLTSCSALMLFAVVVNASLV